jgi:hypothetical protein
MLLMEILKRQYLLQNHYSYNAIQQITLKIVTT